MKVGKTTKKSKLSFYILLVFFALCHFHITKYLGGFAKDTLPLTPSSLEGECEPWPLVQSISQFAVVSNSPSKLEGVRGSVLSYLGFIFEPQILFISLVFSHFGFAEVTLSWKSSNKFGFSLNFSYLCQQLVKKQSIRDESHEKDLEYHNDIIVARTAPLCPGKRESHDTYTPI